MINRGVKNKSQYIFNSQTGRLEKKEENATTIKSASKQKSTHAKDISDVVEKANNKNKTAKPISNITVITAEDNLIHNYFYDFETSWDAQNCLSIATIKMPKMGADNVNYWSTYQGALTVYAGYNFKFDKVNSNKYSTEQNAANSLVKYGDDAEIKPFFRGNVSRIKERQNDIIIYVDSIGVRFKQKIPDEFRQQYINNQNVRDAFQAICEFLGVQYICPPKEINETMENTTSNQVSTDGSENNIDKKQESEQQITDIAVQKAQQANQQIEDNNTTNTNNNSTPTDNPALTNNQEIIPSTNGYADINFDANGAITHGTNAIETSPDMSKVLLELDENPLERYLEDETGIVEKIQKYLDGDMFEELHNNVMDYNAITVTPTSTMSSDISSTSTSPNNGTTDTNNKSSSNNGTSSSSSSGNKTSSNKKNGWRNGQYFIGGKIYLSKAYINSLSPEQARQKRTQAYKDETYTDDTMQKLLWRSLGQKLE